MPAEQLGYPDRILKGACEGTVGGKPGTRIMGKRTLATGRKRRAITGVSPVRI